MGKRLPASYVQFGALALVMRLPVVVIAPLLGVVQRDFHLSAAAAGLLTGLPVLCFAVFAVPAGALLRRYGLQRAVTAALLVLIVAGFLRVTGGLVLLFAGTALIGCALAVVNVALVVMISEWFPSPGMATGVQVAASNVGSAAASAAVVPLALIFGWRVSTALFGAAVVVVLVLWHVGRASPPVGAKPVLKPAPGDDDPPSTHPASAGRTSMGWVLPLLLVLAFAGHNLGYYGMTSWAPSVLVHNGHVSRATSGLGASLFQGLGIAGALSVPLLASRGRSPLVLMIAAGTAWFLMPTGLLLLPKAWPIWVVSGGLAQGGTFAVIAMLIVAVPGTVSVLASRVQAAGYGAAAAGPVALGALHDASSGWTVPLVAVQVVMVVMTLSGIAAAVMLRRSASNHAHAMSRASGWSTPAMAET